MNLHQRDKVVGHHLVDIALKIGTTILIFCGLCLVIGVLFLAVGISASIFTILLSTILTATLIILKNTQETRSGSGCALVSLVLLAILAVSVCVSCQFYDLSFDGQVYHQKAVIQLAEGWNPLYQTQPSDDIFIDHYPKGPWIIEAVFYKAFKHIETAKALNLLLMAAAFLASLAAMLEFDSRRKTLALAMSGLLALNPVSVYQSLSFYVDGQLSSLFVCIIALSYLFLRSGSSFVTLALCSAIIMFINIKFTAVLYALVMISGLIIAGLMSRSRKRIFELALVSVFSVFIGIVAVGFNPYVTNIFEHGHPFYPLAGNGAVDIISGNIPEDFEGVNRFSSFLMSSFAESGNSVKTGSCLPKWPFKTSIYELKSFTTTDVRIGGFGPLFSGAFILAILLITGSLFAKINQKKQSMRNGLLGIILIVFISSIVNPEIWWARYCPQIWIMLILAALLGIYSTDYKLVNVMSLVLLGILILNVILVAVIYCGAQYVQKRKVVRQLSEMSVCSSNVLVDFNGFDSNRIRLQEAGIRYLETEKLSNPEKMTCSKMQYQLK